MYQPNFQYYPGYAGIPGQPGAQPVVPGGAPDANGNLWDPTAAPPFYPQPQGWGGYYSECA